MQAVEKFESLRQFSTIHQEEQDRNISLPGCTYHAAIPTFVQEVGIRIVLLYHSCDKRNIRGQYC